MTPTQLNIIIWLVVFGLGFFTINQFFEFTKLAEAAKDPCGVCFSAINTSVERCLNWAYITDPTHASKLGKIETFPNITNVTIIK